jgi:hypothetical protein
MGIFHAGGLHCLVPEVPSTLKHMVYGLRMPAIHLDGREINQVASQAIDAIAPRSWKYGDRNV